MYVDYTELFFLLSLMCPHYLSEQQEKVSLYRLVDDRVGAGLATSACDNSVGTSANTWLVDME